MNEKITRQHMRVFEYGAVGSAISLHEPYIRDFGVRRRVEITNVQRIEERLREIAHDEVVTRRIDAKVAAEKAHVAGVLDRIRRFYVFQAVIAGSLGQERTAPGHRSEE